MSGLETLIVMTIRIPFWGVILGIGILVPVITFLWLTLQDRFAETKLLTRRIVDLKTEIGTLESQYRPTSVVQEAYLQFTYNISHEVSNPLQSVQTNLEIMADCSPEETGRWRQYYAIIKQEIKRLFTLTENLRLLAQLDRVGESVKREPINLKSVIEDVIMSQSERASTKNVYLTYEGPNRPAKVLGNREHLYQLIVNLLDNSIKYSKDTGGQIVIVLREEGDYVRVLVKDDGIGIPKEDLPFVFDTAYRSPNTLSVRSPGSGLGLAIVKRIVAQHEGKITVDSIFEKGTIITVELPLYYPETPVSELERK